MDTCPANIIYGLVDPRTLLIRYVGLSTRGLKRPMEHRKRTRRASYCYYWVRSLQRDGLDYKIVVLEVCQEAASLPEAERWWIAYGRISAWPLTNIASGGPDLEALAARRLRRELADLIKWKRDPVEVEKRCMQILDDNDYDRAPPIAAVVLGARVTFELAKCLYQRWKVNRSACSKKS